MAYADQTIGVESAGDPYARNTRSSAFGPGQFIKDTWIDLISRHRPDLAQSMNRDQLLQLRSDPSLSRAMVEAYGNENAGALTKAGYEATDGNKYLAHFAGRGGALSVLGASPDQRVDTILSPQAIKANPFLKDWTAEQLIDWANKKQGGPAPVRVASSSPPSSTSYAPVDDGIPSHIAGAMNSLSAQRQPQGPTKMPEQEPSLGAKFMSGGLGALFGQPNQNFSLGGSLRNAAGFLMAHDVPGALALTAPQDNTEVVKAPDGSMQIYNKRSGNFTKQLAAPVGQMVTLGKDITGNDIKGFQIGNRIFDGTGRLVGDYSSAAGGQAGADGQAGAGGQAATGVPGAAGPQGFSGTTSFDASKLNNDAATGDEYLQSIIAANPQMGKPIAADIKAMAEGRQAVPVNSRLGQTSLFRQLAQRYGEITGIDMDQANVKARSKMMEQLNSGAPSSLGNQLTSAETTYGHLANDIGDIFQKLQNYGGFGVVPQLAEGLNTMKNKFIDERADLVRQLQTARHRFSSEANRFYVGQGTGAERAAGAEAWSEGLRPKAAADLMRRESHLFMSKVEPVLRNIEQTLGVNHPRAVEYRKRFKALHDRAEAQADVLENGRLPGTAANKPTFQFTGPPQP